MIELPEAYTLANQLNQTFIGKTIVSAAAGTSKHSFAWYTGDPVLYNDKLSGRKVIGTAAYGGRPELQTDEITLSFIDGIRFRYLEAGEKRPDKHQFLLEFDDETGFCCTIQMYGGFILYADGQPNEDFYYNAAKEKPAPFTDAFDMAYFNGLFDGIKKSLSVKALLATEQRIPGLGNGVLHDILFNARIHPKRKAEALSDDERNALFNSVKSTLAEMRDSGGLKREAYLGGSIYFCPVCQK